MSFSDRQSAVSVLLTAYCLPPTAYRLLLTAHCSLPLRTPSCVTVHAVRSYPGAVIGNKSGARILTQVGHDPSALPLCRHRDF
ncbi:MAG TPA: hypothetical protein VF020_23905, partial [Chthoniobacterales bacterium]